MRYALVTYGSRGDVQPFVCLGRALADRGHEVRIVGPRNGAAMVAAAGLEHCELPVDTPALLATDAARRMLAHGRSLSFFRWLQEREREMATPMRASLVRGTEAADVIVCHPLLLIRCAAIARARGAMLAALHLCPAIPSGEYPSLVIARRDLGPLNRASHRLPFELLWRSGRADLQRLSAELGVPMPSRAAIDRLFRGEGAPMLLGYSQALFPSPGDWPASVAPAGFLAPWPALRARLGEHGVDLELERWLGAGPPPVFLGFGSLPVLDPEGMLRTVRRALQAAGVRGIVGAGWSDFADVRDETLYVVGEVDHQSLLPRCAAAVHHGGAGTTHTSVGAGVPTLVCSVFADQPFWGARCRRAGVGDTLPFARLDTARLYAGLRAVLDPGVRRRAREVAGRMAAEDGVGVAVARLEECSADILHSDPRSLRMVRDTSGG